MFRPAGSIYHRKCVFLRHKQVLAGLLLYAAGNAFDIFIILTGILVNLMNRGARNNIMELVCQNVLPPFGQLLLLCPCKASCMKRIHHREPFGSAVKQLHFAVHALVIALAGISAAVVFQIQLPVPRMDVLVCMLDGIMQLFKIFPCGGYPDIRKSRYFI